jgi:outer membrane protein assembly factor BamB
VGSDDGPRSTPTLDGTAVYVLTSYLKLYRLNAASGEVVWSTNLLAGFAGRVIAWQNAASPLVCGDLIFVNANCRTRTLMAFNKSNGTLAWRSQDEIMTHATPVAATIDSVLQIIFATQTGFVSLDPSTGTRLWKFVFPSPSSTSLAVSPVVYSNIVFTSAGYGFGAVAASIARSGSLWTATEVFYNPGLQSHWMTPVCRDGYLYGQFGSSLIPAQMRFARHRHETWSTDGFGRGGTVSSTDASSQSPKPANSS